MQHKQTNKENEHLILLIVSIMEYLLTTSE